MVEMYFLKILYHIQPIATPVNWAVANPGSAALLGSALGAGTYFGHRKWNEFKQNRIKKLSDQKSGWQKTLVELNKFLEWNNSQFLLPSDFSDADLVMVLKPLATENKKSYPSDTHRVIDSLKTIYSEIEEARKEICNRWLEKLGGPVPKDVIENFTVGNLVTYFKTVDGHETAKLHLIDLAKKQKGVPLPDWKIPENLLGLVTEMTLLNNKLHKKKRRSDERHQRD